MACACIKRLILFVVLLTSVPLLVSAQEQHTLIVHHFLSPTHILQTKLLQPLGETLEKKSQGRLQFDIYPSMTLGGKAQDLYNQVKDGSVDIVWSLIGYTPGVFPRSEVFELPGVHHSSAVATSLAMFDVRDKLADDFNKVELLFLHVHPGNAIHTVSNDIVTMADLRGLKLRTPSRTGAWMIETWDASPVGMPIPALPQALSRKAVDGALVPFEVMPSLGLEKLTNYSALSPNNGRFGTAVFMLLMNKERFQSLPGDLQQLIKEETGEARIRNISQKWEESDRIGLMAQEDTGSTIRIISEENMIPFVEGFKTVTERWVEEADAKNIEGSTLLKAAQDAIARREQER